MTMYFVTFVLHTLNEQPPQERSSVAKDFVHYTMRNHMYHATQKQNQEKRCRDSQTREGLLLLKIKSTSRHWMTFRPTPKARMPKVSSASASVGRSSSLQLPAIAGQSSLLFQGMLQRLADFSNPISNESGLHEAYTRFALATLPSHCAPSREVDEHGTMLGLVRPFKWSACKCTDCFGGAGGAGLSGVDTDREAQIDLTDIVDFGDSLWHKVAGAREKKARELILHGDMKEHIAYLAITIEGLRWLTGRLLFHGAPRHRESRWSIPPRCSFTRPVLRGVQHISLSLSGSPSRLRMAFGTRNFANMQPHLNEAFRTGLTVLSCTFFHKLHRWKERPALLSQIVSSRTECATRLRCAGKFFGFFFWPAGCWLLAEVASMCNSSLAVAPVFVPTMCLSPGVGSSGQHQPDGVRAQPNS